MPSDRIRRFLEEARAAGVFPGASLLVGHRGEVALSLVVGEAQRDEEVRPLAPGTRFDLASVTKAIGTATVAMLAVADGRAALEEPLGERLELPPALARQPAWHLLAHASGLPPWAPLYGAPAEAAPGPSPRARRARARAWIRRAAAETPLLGAPGRGSIYSDLGFLVLEWWLETVFGERIDRVLARRVLAPLGLAETGYVDLDRPRTEPPEGFAATERCPYRGRVVVGEVHDLNAWAMGGVAGQAGIFSTARDLHRLLGALHRAFAGGEGPVPGAVVRRFWQPAPVPGSTFRLGWDGPSPAGYSAAGSRMPREAVGHLGFTGCSVWLAPAEALWVILLTNRVHPSVRNTRIRELRPALHDLVLGELGLGRAM